MHQTKNNDTLTFWSHTISLFRSFPHVRVQTNAYPRNVQTKLDLYLSTMHGLGGVIVILKMKTYRSFRNEVPNFDIQLVMQPSPLTPM